MKSQKCETCENNRNKIKNRFRNQNTYVKLFHYHSNKGDQLNNLKTVI